LLQVAYLPIFLTIELLSLPVNVSI